MSNLGQFFKVGDIAQRVTDGFTEHRLGFGVDQFFKAFRMAVIREAHFNAILRQGVCKQIVGATI